MASAGKLTIEAKVVPPDLPVATFDSGVWHCEGRLVTRETAKTAYEEALFWLAVHRAEEAMREVTPAPMEEVTQIIADAARESDAAHWPEAVARALIAAGYRRPTK